MFCFLQATKALWEILQLPSHTGALMEYFPYLFLALLFQTFFRTEQMPEEVNTFWRQCQEEGCLPTNPNRYCIPVLPSLPWPWSWGQGSQHHLGFALHTDLQC